MDEIKKSKKAIALKYDVGKTAPEIIAKGKGLVAEKILENRGNIPIYENKELVAELDKLDIGAQIPPELYQVVAQVLLFISDLDKINKYKSNAK